MRATEPSRRGRALPGARLQALKNRARKGAPTARIWFSIISMLALAGCERPDLEVHSAETHMGTEMEITALGLDRAALEAAVRAAFAEAARIEGLTSLYREDSELCRLNRSAGGGALAVDPELFELIARAMEISRQSDGAFDVTMGAFKGLWSFKPGSPRHPAAGEIEDRLALVGWQKIVLDPENKTVRLPLAGMRIDLGGIAPGYAADRMIAVLAGRGLTRAMVNAGGEVRVMGGHGGRPWNIGVQDPRDRDNIIASVPLFEGALSTSGDYEKFFIEDGVRYSHILTPATGLPAMGCQSVTVAAAEAWRADALATAVFVLGPGPGMALIEADPGAEAIVIAKDGKRLVSSGLKGRFTWRD